MYRGNTPGSYPRRLENSSLVSASKWNDSGLKSVNEYTNQKSNDTPVRTDRYDASVINEENIDCSDKENEVPSEQQSSISYQKNSETQHKEEIKSQIQHKEETKEEAKEETKDENKEETKELAESQIQYKEEPKNKYEIESENIIKEETDIFCTKLSYSDLLKIMHQCWSNYNCTKNTSVKIFEDNMDPVKFFKLIGNRKLPNRRELSIHNIDKMSKYFEQLFNYFPDEVKHLTLENSTSADQVEELDKYLPLISQRVKYSITLRNFRVYEPRLTTFFKLFSHCDSISFTGKSLLPSNATLNFSKALTNCEITELNLGMGVHQKYWATNERRLFVFIRALQHSQQLRKSLKELHIGGISEETVNNIFKEFDWQGVQVREHREEEKVKWLNTGHEIQFV